MIGCSTDNGGVESYIMNLYQQLKDKYEFAFLLARNGDCRQKVGVS